MHDELSRRSILFNNQWLSSFLSCAWSCLLGHRCGFPKGGGVEGKVGAVPGAVVNIGFLHLSLMYNSTREDADHLERGTRAKRMCVK